MRISHRLATAAVFLALFADAAATTSGETEPARTIVLGVEHAGQLVSEADRAGMLAAFIEKVAPSAVCVERAPAKFARGDYYEFTYEIQDVVLPYARQRGLEICPFDWEPSHADMLLGWGMDLSRPPEVRPASGFQGFLSFPNPASLERGLFRADDPGSLSDVHAWIRGPSAQASHDLARRMFLYRTFLQARGIAAAARQRPGQTLLVVVGEFHKHDIEAILADDPAVMLVQPSDIGLPAAEDAERLTTRAHRIAVASFNLLGVQADTGNVDWRWVGRELDALERERVDAETRLLRTRYELLTGQIGAAAAVKRYRRIAADPTAHRMPTWNGVLDGSRVDSYFDPFANLRIDQRVLVEMARSLYREADPATAERLLAELVEELDPRKARQLEVYWRRDIVAPDPAEAD